MIQYFRKFKKIKGGFERNEKESQKEAGMILGQILKKVIYEDTRLFEIQKEDVNGQNYQVTKYKLVN